MYIRAPRYPVWALWAFVVAKREGYHDREAKSLALAAANLNAAAKFGGHLAVRPRPPRGRKPAPAPRAPQTALDMVGFLGRKIYVTIQAGEYVAILCSRGRCRPISPDDFDRKVVAKLGDAFPVLYELFERLAFCFDPHELDSIAYRLYASHFAPTREEDGRPVYGPKGKPIYPGRGVPGIVDTERIEALIRRYAKEAVA